MISMGSMILSIFRKYSELWWVVIAFIPCTLGPVSASEITPTMTGPKSTQEAQLLWTQGQKAFGSGTWDDAVYYLSRLTEQYPAGPGAREAHLLLGISWLRKNAAEEALKPLKYYIEASPMSTEATRARLLLSRAYMALKRFREASLQSVETLKQSSAQGELRWEALVLFAWAQMGLNQEERARRTLATIHKEISDRESNPKLNTETLRLETELRIQSCEHFAEGAKLSETQAMNAIRERGLCLLETLPVVKNAVLAGDHDHAVAALDAVSKGFVAYQRRCENPPLPNDSKTKRELQSYLSELRMALTKICNETKAQATAALAGWKKELGEARSTEVSRLRERLEQL